MAPSATSCIVIAVTLLCVALQASATPVRAVPPPIVADRPHHVVPALASVGKGLPEHMSCDSCQEIVGTAINLTEVRMRAPCRAVVCVCGGGSSTRGLCHAPTTANLARV